jgi:hypothetical protein
MGPTVDGLRPSTFDRPPGRTAWGSLKGFLCSMRDLPDKPLNLGPRWTDGGKGGSPNGVGSQDATGDRRTRTSRGEP